MGQFLGRFELRLPASKHLFGLFTIGDVPGNPCHSTNFTVVISDGKRAILNPPERFVGSHNPIFRLSATDALLPNIIFHNRAIGGKNRFDKGFGIVQKSVCTSAPNQRISGTHIYPRATIRRNDVLVLIDDPEDILNVLRELAKDLLVFRTS